MIKFSNFIIMLIFGINLMAQSGNDPSKFTTANMEAEQTGRILYELDLAASRATDEVMRQTGETAKKELKGWFTEFQGEHIITNFFVTNKNGDPGIKYSVTTSNGTVVPNSFKVYENVMDFTENEKIKHIARNLAMKSITEPCSRYYNPAIIPLPADEGYLVYAIPGTDKPQIVLTGGFFRYEISKDGTKILKQRKFTNSCLELQNPPNAQGLFTTHILDKSPTEIHVYLSLIHKIQLYVCTVDNRYLWSVSEGKIRFVQIIDEN